MIRNHIVYNPVVDWTFELERAEGAYVWDTKGNQYIDFTSGWNTTNLGWNHPEVNEAVSQQAQKNVYAPMWTSDVMQELYAKELTESFPNPLDAVCRATGGTEANEMALKIARAVTGRQKIVSFKNTYHGQSFGTLALGFVPSYVERIAPLVPEFVQITYPAVSPQEKNGQDMLEHFLTTLESHLRKETVAAFFTEPGLITGWGSMFVAPQGYLRAVRKLTEKYGTLLVVDEVGSGFSRTGRLFGIEHEQVIPDIVTLAKGISNGAAPLGAVVTKSALIEEHIGEFKPTSTFGWTPLACAAGLKTLQIHKRDKVWKEAEQKGAFVISLLEKAQRNGVPIKNIRGMGLSIAFDSEHDYDAIIKKAYTRGVHIANAGESIQLMPPLTTSDDVLHDGIERLMDCVK